MDARTEGGRKMKTQLTGQPVWDLQEMLLVLSQEYPQIPVTRPSGTFGEKTLEGVMVFQRDHHLPVTGIVDHATWQAISQQYRDTLRRIGEPPALRVMHNSKGTLQDGDCQPQVRLIQVMFDSLVPVLSGFQSTGGDGVFHDATVENTRRVQRAAGLEETGIMDRASWDSLVRLYHLFITRGN